MELQDARFVSSKISEMSGLSLQVDAKFSENKNILIFHPDIFTNKDGFSFLVEFVWKKLNIEFIPEEKSGELLLSMGQASIENKQLFGELAEKIKLLNGSLIMLINNQEYRIENYQNWPVDWNQFSLKFKSPFVETDTDLFFDENINEYLINWLNNFILMVLVLLPTKDVVYSLDSVPEGAKYASIVSKYERSRINRQVCISVYGSVCQICGFDFGKFYGPDGDGYIEVHHVIPVSQIGENYKVNPLNDLIPICSNCHSMIHRKNPPYSPEELKKKILNLEND